MTIELRELRDTDWDMWFGTLELAFGGVRSPEESRELWRRNTEPERSIAAWEGERIVGSAGAFSFQITVPGGALAPAAGVTCVGVQPTHRRRGLLRLLMRQQLDDIHHRGEALAVLFASEPDIYGRFGYGIGTQQLYADIDTTRVELKVPEGVDEIRLAFGDPLETLQACEAVYARRVPSRPGMLARRPGWEGRGVLDPESERKGASPLQCLLAYAEDEVVGYARYAVRPDWDHSGPDGLVQLRDLEALTPAAYAALWRFLFTLDLTSSVKAGNRPVDDPWIHMVSDVRRCGLSIHDALHVRVVDVPAALESRAYVTPLDVVFEVADPFCPWNEGRWRLSGNGKSASCARTDEPADLRLSAGELGAAYLGGVSLASLAGAGRVREVRQGALREASVAFLSDVAPWVPHGF